MHCAVKLQELNRGAQSKHAITQSGSRPSVTHLSGDSSLQQIGGDTPTGVTTVCCMMATGTVTDVQ
jgi:hypothetical protein